MGSECQPGWVEGWAFVLVEEEEGGKSRVEGSRGEEEHGVTEVIKDRERADVCLESDIAGPYGQRRTPLSKKLHFF